MAPVFLKFCTANINKKGWLMKRRVNYFCNEESFASNRQAKQRGFTSK